MYLITEIISYLLNAVFENCAEKALHRFFSLYPSFHLTKQNSNLNVSQVPLVTSGLVESECTDFSERLSSLDFIGLIFKIIKLFHISAIFLRIVFHSQT